MLTKKERKKVDQKKARRMKRSRAKIYGTPKRPRLSVHVSLSHCYAQIIDDSRGVTLVSVSDFDKDINAKTAKKTEKARQVGENIASKALQKKITHVVFDRHGAMFHGRIQAVADGARKTGLIF